MTSGESCGVCGYPVTPVAGSPNQLRRRLPQWLRRSFNALQLARIRREARRRGPAEERVRRLRAANPDLGLDDFAAVAVFFNPLGLRSRRENFRRFYAGIAQAGVPVLVVELAFGDRPHEIDEASDVLRVRASDVLWHKERLLNLGIAEQLRRGYRKIAWLDADISFDEPEHWPWLVAAELEHAIICQVFEHARALQASGPAVPGASAVSYLQEMNEARLQFATPPSLRRPLGQPLGLSGYGWAARAELLREVPLYDAGVIGGGDKMLFLAATQNSDARWKETVDATVGAPFQRCQRCGSQPRSEAYEQHFEEWARRWNKAIAGRVAFAATDLRTFFHGDWNRRRYLNRREILLRHHYDPAVDVALNDDGCWRWASAKPGLHDEVSSYFTARDEDTPDPATA